MLTTWNAVSTLDRMLDDVMGSAFGTATNPRTFNPTIDIRTSEDEVVFVCDVPGMKQEDLEITLENHVLTLKGARKFEGREKEQVLLGRAYGTFSRSFTLPDALDEEKLSAELADGVLTVRVPRHPKAKPRKIAINGGSMSGGSKQLNE
ncbi:MAG TPA: Hsp20/alpha crystallin family protein [Polyangiaceae bacterium]|nr:Hsp20/alpha crystallin family protein [Polyangiaceae bacterium]